MPSDSASSISSGSAGISSGDSSAITVTSSTPSRRAARATSRVVVMARRASSGVPDPGLVGDHVLPGLGRPVGRGPQRGAGRVEGHVAPTDHDHPLAERRPGTPGSRSTGTRRRATRRPGRGPGRSRPRPRPVPTATNNASCRVSSSSRVASTPDPEPQLDLDAELHDGLDLAGDELARQPVLGDPEHHHPAEPVGGLVDGHRMAGQAQLVGRGQPGRAATDDPDRRPGRSGTGPCASCHTAAASKLSTPNCSVTYRFRARMATGASTVPRRQAGSHGAAQTRPQIEANGFGAAGDEVGVAGTSLGDGGDVGPGVGVDRAGGAAGLVVPQPGARRARRDGASDQAPGLQATQDPGGHHQHDHEHGRGQVGEGVAAHAADAGEDLVGRRRR